MAKANVKCKNLIIIHYTLASPKMLAFGNKNELLLHLLNRIFVHYILFRIFAVETVHKIRI